MQFQTSHQKVFDPCSDPSCIYSSGCKKHDNTLVVVTEMWGVMEAADAKYFPMIHDASNDPFYVRLRWWKRFLLWCRNRHSPGGR